MLVGGCLESQTRKQRAALCHLLALHQLQQRVCTDNGVKLPGVLVHLAVPATAARVSRQRSGGRCKRARSVTKTAAPVPFLKIFAARGFEPRLTRLQRVRRRGRRPQREKACLLKALLRFFRKVLSLPSTKRSGTQSQKRTKLAPEYKASELVQVALAVVHPGQPRQCSRAHKHTPSAASVLSVSIEREAGASLPGLQRDLRRHVI